MKNINRILLLSALLIVISGISISAVSGHVPVDAGNNSDLYNAQVIDNPTKSWAIYTNLDDDKAVGYYYFKINSGETILVQLFVSTRTDESTFVPKFALMGFSLTGNESVPDHVQTVGGVIAIQSERSHPTYESFGPSHLVEVSKIKLIAPETATYFVVVYSNTGPGHYGLAIGTNESFTLGETIMTPINVINVYIWQGESWFTILLPYILTITIAAIYFAKFAHFPSNLQKFMFWLGIAFLSSSVSFTYQIVYNVLKSELGGEVIISLVIATIQAAIGSGVLMLVKVHKFEMNLRKQLRLIILSLLSLMTWVGFIVAPMLGILLSVVLIARNFKTDETSPIST